MNSARACSLPGQRGLLLNWKRDLFWPSTSPIAPSEILHITPPWSSFLSKACARMILTLQSATQHTTHGGLNVPHTAECSQIATNVRYGRGISTRNGERCPHPTHAMCRTSGLGLSLTSTTTTGAARQPVKPSFPRR